MQVHLLLAIALTGPPVIPPLALGAELRAAPWTAEELRGEFRDVLQRTRREATFQPERDVPDLVLLYGVLNSTDALPRSERVRMLQRLDYWLEESAERLRRARARRIGRASKGDRLMERQSRSHQPAPMDNRPLLAGGAETARSLELIDLIESTISPETWDVNGGRGKAHYYSPLHVLVVRNSQSVHEELGGMLGVLEGRSSR